MKMIIHSMLVDVLGKNMHVIPVVVVRYCNIDIFHFRNFFVLFKISARLIKYYLATFPLAIDPSKIKFEFLSNKLFFNFLKF